MCCDVADNAECSQQSSIASLAAGPSAANAAELQHDSSLYVRVQHDETKPGRESDKPVGSGADCIQQASPSVFRPTHSFAVPQAALLQHDPLLHGDHGRETDEMKPTGSSGHNNQVAGVIEVAARATAAGSHDAAMMAVGRHSAAGAGSSSSTPQVGITSSSKADAGLVVDPVQTQTTHVSPREFLQQVHGSCQHHFADVLICTHYVLAYCDPSHISVVAFRRCCFTAGSVFALSLAVEILVPHLLWKW